MLQKLSALIQARHSRVTWAYLDRDNYETAQEGHGALSTRVRMIRS